jgi:hypothetical protein
VEPPPSNFNRVRDDAVGALRAEKEISERTNVQDPWGTTYKVLCTDDDVTVLSFGPDKVQGTDDDIRIPEKNATRGARTPN